MKSVVTRISDLAKLHNQGMHDEAANYILTENIEGIETFVIEVFELTPDNVNRNFAAAKKVLSACTSAGLSEFRKLIRVGYLEQLIIEIESSEEKIKSESGKHKENGKTAIR